MSGLLTRCLTSISTNCATKFSKVDWQARDTVLACLTAYVLLKHYFTRDVTELDQDVDILSEDVKRLKGKLEDVSATTQKQKRDLLVLKADTNEMLFALEFKLQAIESNMKSGLARDVAKDCLTHEAELCYA
jgi:hypothetical protein